MATWSGTAKKFKLLDCRSYGDETWEDVEFNWSYGTVSDILTITKEYPFDVTRKTEVLYSKEEAGALLYMLAQWYSRYEGKEELKELLKEALKD